MKEEGTKGDKNNDRCTVLVTKTSANNCSLVARFHVACFSYFLKSKSNHISEDIYLWWMLSRDKATELDIGYYEMKQ